jgi:hypothetical protein
MAGKKGLWIALGSCGFLLFAGAAFIAIIVFSVVRHLEVRPVSTAAAEQEYGRLRDRFAGQTPLLEIDRDRPEQIRINRSAERISQAGISTIHICAWNPRESKIVKLDLPLWLLRLRPNSESIHWNWSGNELNLENLNVTVEDVERRGPGLILNFEGRHGERVLLWSE